MARKSSTKKVYVVVRNPRTGRSRCITAHGITYREACKRAKEAFCGDRPPARGSSELAVSAPAA